MTVNQLQNGEIHSAYSWPFQYVVLPKQVMLPWIPFVFHTTLIQDKLVRAKFWGLNLVPEIKKSVPVNLVSLVSESAMSLLSPTCTRFNPTARLMR